MHNSENFYFSALSENSDYDPFFEDDYFGDFELDSNLNQIPDENVFDDTEEFFWDD